MTTGPESVRAHTQNASSAATPSAEHLDEDDQVAFKGSAKAFVRTYGFLSAILPYSNATWEKLSTFLDFLIPNCPRLARTT